jgi:hypothetical protein
MFSFTNKNTKNPSQPTKYIKIIDSTLKTKSPDLRNEIYKSENDILGLKSGISKFAVEYGFVTDQKLLNNIENNTTKEIASLPIRFFRQLSDKSPGLGSKAAKQTANITANIHNTATSAAKHLDNIQSQEAKNLKDIYQQGFGGRKSKKTKNTKKMKSKKRKTRKNARK